MPQSQDQFFKRDAFTGGREFLFKNDADQILFRARMAASLLTLLMMVLVFLAAREMFGTAAGFIALGLLAFDPTVLAHGAFVTTDMGLSCFMFASIYAFYRYVKAPSPRRLIVAGLVTGLALASKHSAILVFPMLVLLAIYEAMRRGSPAEPPVRASKRKRTLRLAGDLVLLSLISVGVLWSFYGFRYQARPAGMQLNPPLADYVKSLSRPRDVKLLTTVARWRLLPESYIYGLADVRITADFYSTYVLGQDYPKGQWFYFPVAFAVKSSLTFLIMFAVTGWVIASGRLRTWREILFLTVPPDSVFCRGHGIRNEHRRPPHFAGLYISCGADRGGLRETDCGKPPLGLHRAGASCVSGRVGRAHLSRVYRLRQRTLGRPFANLQIPERLQRRLGAATEIHQTLSRSARN